MRLKNSEGTLNPYEISGGEIQPDDRFGYKVIAVVYSDQEWMAYSGYTDWSDEKIAANGDEVFWDVAKYLFSTIANTIPHYRQP
jgi:hypothetical protein